MSSSKDSGQQRPAPPPPENNIGTIFLGPGPEQETTLEKLRTAKVGEGWSHQTEKEYLDRIKDRATEKVKELLLHARERGDEIKAEAEAVRAEADRALAEAGRTLAEAGATRQAAELERQQATEKGFAEGFASGQAEAWKRLAETRSALGEATGVVLLSIQKQCGQIFEAWRRDLVDLLREAVEKTTGLIISTERAAMLDTLLEQSVRALLNRQEFTVKVNPEDAELVTGILADATHTGTRVSNWELRADPALKPGSLVVESAVALIDNSRAARRSVVDEVLANLGLPSTQADLDAVSRVADDLLGGLEKNGIRVKTEEEAAAPDLPDPGADLPPDATPDLPPDIPPDPRSDSTENVDQGQTVTDAQGSAAQIDPAADPSADPAAGQDSDAQPESPTPETQDAVPPAEKAATRAQDSQVEADGLIDEFLGDLTDLVTEPGPNVPNTAGADDGGLPPDVADDLLAEMGFGAK